MKKVVAIDQDQVLADLMTKWVEDINVNENESVNPSDIKCWDMTKYFNCGTRVYDYLTYELFRNLPVIKDSQEVVEKLMRKYDVYIVTSATKHPASLLAKVEWLHEFFPYVPDSKIVLCGDKKIIKADVMIDDGIHNLETFDGYKILFDAPHNRENNVFHRVHNWKEIERILEVS